MVATKTYTVIMVDIVGYTKLDQVKQLQLFREMQKEMNYIFYEELTEERAVVIPLGDGMIIAVNEKTDSSYLQDILDKIILIFKWVEHKGVKLRCALNAGSGYQVKDINKNENIVGDIINDTNRLLTDISENTIVVSESFYKRFLKKEDLAIGTEVKKGDISFKIIDENYIIDKHENFHRTFAIALKKEGFSIGEDGEILSKYLAKVYSKEYPKDQNKKERFYKMVKLASDLNFIGLCHNSLIGTLNQIEANRHRRVKIRVYFPKDEILDQMVKAFAFEQDKYSVERKGVVIARLKEWVSSFTNKEYVVLEIYEYKEFLTYGASTVDLEMPDKGFIHISHYLKGIPPEESPYIEVYWKIHSVPPPLYKLYKEHLQSTVFRTSTLVFTNNT